MKIDTTARQTQVVNREAEMAKPKMQYHKVWYCSTGSAVYGTSCARRMQTMVVGVEETEREPTKAAIELARCSLPKDERMSFEPLGVKRRD